MADKSEFETLRRDPSTLVYMFPNTVSGLELFEYTAGTHRAMGYRTLSTVETHAGIHQLHVLLCVPPKHASRKERGL